MITTPSIIISSGGRTGTTFLADFFSKTLDGCIALHEPGAVKWKSLKKLPGTIRHFGLKNIVFKKLVGSWGISVLSNKRISGTMTEHEVAERLYRERHDFIEKLSCQMYVESSYQYYGILDILPQVFQNVKIIYVIRHGYDWVSSHMNKNDWYASGDIHRLLGLRLTPNVSDGIFYERWKGMSQFEKVCWSWQKINSFALKSIEALPQARVYRFEDLFYSKKGTEYLDELILFAKDCPANQWAYHSPENVLEKKVNKPSNYDFPSWTQLPDVQKRQFIEICGPLMDKFGYQLEN